MFHYIKFCCTIHTDENTALPLYVWYGAMIMQWNVVNPEPVPVTQDQAATSDESQKPFLLEVTFDDNVWITSIFPGHVLGKMVWGQNITFTHFT